MIYFIFYCEPYSSKHKGHHLITIIIFKLGTNKWYFFNDNACLTEENKVADNVYIEDINFSTCATNEFNCFDGTW